MKVENGRADSLIGTRGNDIPSRGAGLGF